MNKLMIRIEKQILNLLMTILLMFWVGNVYSALGTAGGKTGEGIEAGNIDRYSLSLNIAGVTDSDWNSIQNKLELEGYIFYSYKKGKTKNYIVGYFKSRDSAIQVIQNIRQASDKKIKITIRDIDESDHAKRLQWKNEQKAKVENNSIDKELAFLMAQARQAMIKNDYRVAISKYTKVMSYQAPEYSQSALEYLALARERSNHMAHAKSEYERYLRLYPKTEGAERVRQRLDGLMSAALLPRKKLKKYKRRGFKSGWISVSSLTQSYRTDRDIVVPIGDNRVLANAFSSFFYSTSKKSLGYEFKNQISMSNNYDLENEDEDNSLVKISYLYTESKFKKLGVSSRIGRQRYNASGAFGRFDGAVVGYNFSDNVKFSATSGYPVSFHSYQRVQEEKPFYSANIELDSLFGLFDVNTYFITQYSDALLDRQAIGFDVRHFTRKQTFFSTVDYDISYDVVNNFMLNMSTKINKNNSIGTYATFRRSPLLTTSNSLQGQFVGSLGELLEEKDNEEKVIRQLARDRTAKYGSLTLNWKQHIKKDMEINHDYTLSKLGGTVSSDGIEGFDATGYEDFFSSQFMASNLWTRNDMLLVGVTHAIMDSSDRTTFTVHRRDQISSKFLLSTKLRAEYHERSNGDIIKIIKPAVKINYRYTRKYKFETEIGLDRRIRENSFDEGEYQTLFFSAGYTAQF